MTSIEEEIFTKLEWKRASQIFEDPVLFSDRICGENIECGAIGTYYFLAVLCEMAEAPERILDVFLTSENDAGIYELKFFINGVLTSVLVDDYLPVLKGTNQIAFARSKQPEMWVSLIEKGWAKLHGSYSAIHGGLPAMAASHLLGVPSKTLRHEDY